MSSHRSLIWLRAAARPAPLLGLAMIAMLWTGLFYLLSDHHGHLADPQARRAMLLPLVAVLTGLELVTVIASIRRRSSLERTNQRFTTALENMTHGLCMFDGNKRLVVCNERYAKLYRLPQQLLKVGTSHEAIIAHRVTNGLLRGDSSAGAVDKKLGALGEHSAEKISSRIDELADGSLIRVTRQPMADGGWVAPMRTLPSGIGWRPSATASWRRKAAVWSPKAPSPPSASASSKCSARSRPVPTP